MIYVTIVAILLNIVSAGALIRIAPQYLAEESEIEVFQRKPIFIYSCVMILINVSIMIFVSLFYKDNSLLQNVRMLSFMSLLWPIAFIDYKTNRIPNILIIFGLVYRVIILGFELLTVEDGVWWGLATDAIAAVAIGGVMLLASLIARNGIGFGDIKLMVVMCLLLGMSGVWAAIFFSLIIAFITAVALLITKRKKKQDLMPFAPAIMLGTYLAIILTGI
jgi:prepilin signal peptidase PulO-like enzyme (type II secretory pathway)